ncbi:class A beta-lactamase-related serine hydrolase [Flavobacterium sp. ANB]|uniref:serine hydrolase n=1 Tax=unclassified Flavobacterium TaxID=196869 RepID=UPI0012B96981|nr:MULTISPECIES: serine hydrolase [unclassified Flavobacterium]MBF4518335.1 class A beta-lactamase-related serine hydrolase [Flavobacterium sp. ANB]MTD70968.1 serine hydrolase [Flavobacterium sp. LC2016-13]
MKKLFSIITVLIFSSHIMAQQEIKDVDAIILREMHERNIPGLEIAVVHHGKIALSKSYGIANIQDSIKVTNQSVFAVNSITKVFTGVSIMQLVEKGKLDLSLPISHYLDIFPKNWDASITIKHLLTHTSGLPDLLKILDPNTGGMGMLKTEDAVWEKLKTMPMDFIPGEKFAYNQTNAYLLGKLIDKLSERPFTENFTDLQFKPAKMKHTIFGDSRDVIPHFAPTYFWRKNIDGRSLENAQLINNYYEFPYFRRTAAGLNSTAEDMANWVIALQGGKLLQPASLQTMWSPSVFNNGKATPWCLGWGMNKFRKKHRAVGMSGGGRSAFLIYPDDDLAVIILTNLGGSYPEDFLEEIAGVYNSSIPKADLVTNLRTTLRKIGFDNAISFSEKEIKNNPLFVPNEFELNEWAYRMMSKEQNKEALEIFKLNAYLFPDSWNTFDSYGEILLKIGDKKKAIEMYKKSIELNPNNENGKRIVNSLQSK